MSDDKQTTRRGFLGAVGTTGALLGAGSVVGTTFAEGKQVATHYRLGGRTAGWQGLEPASIAATTNPTLNLEAGRDYAITWRNVDGAPHNIAILDEDGNVLLATDIISQQGATQTARFTASEEMATYICQVHPNSMVGNISLGAQQVPAGNQTATQTTTIPNPTEAEVEETTHPLADEYGENPVKFIAEMEPPQGVRTEATGTTWFTLHPPNGVVAKLMYSTYVENVENVTAIEIVLTEGTRPVVANLFQPDNPVDEIEGTLVDAILRSEDLVGPFEGEPLLRLTEAIRNDNVAVVVRTADHPDGALVGPIRAVEELPSGTTTMVDKTTTAVTNRLTEANESAPNQMAGNVNTDDIVSRARAPGLGGFSALGGIAGAVGYMLHRGGDD